MKNKLEIIVIALKIEWCWLFIKVWQKKEEKYMKNGTCLSDEKFIELYKHLYRYCDKAILLNYAYKKRTSIETGSMEVERVTII